jgi:enoyl-CoA hydratase
MSKKYIPMSATILTNREHLYIAVVAINRPAKLNALNEETIYSLHGTLKSLEKDDSVRVIILTGVGEKAFVAGADIAEFVHFSKSEGKELARKGQQLVFDFIENFPKPVIAAVNGFALGGGLELALACHFRYASENAKLGLPEVSLGLIPGYGGTQRLPQLIGKGPAMELIMSGNMMTAATALSFGLVNKVVPQEDLLPSCLSVAAKIASNSSSAITAAINSVNAGFDVDKNGYDTEVKSFGACFGTSDFVEGTSAFLNKRKPKF